MLEYFPNLLAPKFFILYAFIASGVYVHLRGRVRHRFYRQLTDHSTIMAPYNVLMYMFSAVPNKPYVDVAAFPELKKLSDNWQMLRQEAMQLFDEGYIRGAAKYNDLGFNSFFRRGWKRFYVKWYDDPLPSAMALCPKTVALVQSIPSVNAAMFALLPAGGDLGKHRDPFAGSLRYHLGLSTPNSEKCRIFVDGEPYHWRDGEAVIFDETFIHWAENKTDQLRVILFCDVERPLTSRIMSKINHWYESTVIRASQTENMEGDTVGALNKVFGFAYYLRLPAKALKRKSKWMYYTLKWLLLGGLLYWILA
ncbi:MAG: aspartyl/asparaginyl beta-hydroxylase domain-containing protein [Betaproteobacteria bacterium]|nr:MAG: aspartyl/asparaginyl beta-hydroxylase domain-containing protein [Betaproteobacteria bacterium]